MRTHPTLGELALPDPPTAIRERYLALRVDRDRIAQNRQQDERRLAQITDWLNLAPRVEGALETLSRQLFSDVAAILEEKLTMALSEVLDQPIRFRAKSEHSAGAATVEFWIERDGYSEDILRGQGGSVANILSVGLRMFALARLDERTHRRFLVLDEPDAWLRPDLVPRLVKIISLAGRELGFQTILISHHDIGVLEPLADKVYRFEPQPDGTVRVFSPSPGLGVVEEESSEPVFPGVLPL